MQFVDYNACRPANAGSALSHQEIDSGSNSNWAIEPKVPMHKISDTKSLVCFFLQHALTLEEHAKKLGKRIGDRGAG